jgi:hypothetical protein
VLRARYALGAGVEPPSLPVAAGGDVVADERIVGRLPADTETPPFDGRQELGVRHHLARGHAAWSGGSV